MQAARQTLPRTVFRTHHPAVTSGTAVGDSRTLAAHRADQYIDLLGQLSNGFPPGNEDDLSVFPGPGGVKPFPLNPVNKCAKCAEAVRRAGRQAAGTGGRSLWAAHTGCSHFLPQRSEARGTLAAQVSDRSPGAPRATSAIGINPGQENDDGFA